MDQSLPYDENERPIEAYAQEGMLMVKLKDGRLIGTPLEWYPRLLNATQEQLANVEFSTAGVHWPDLDEDLGVEGMLKGTRPRQKLENA